MNDVLNWAPTHPKGALVAASCLWLLCGVFLTYVFVERAMDVPYGSMMLGTVITLVGATYFTSVLTKKLI